MKKMIVLMVTIILTCGIKAQNFKGIDFSTGVTLTSETQQPPMEKLIKHNNNYYYYLYANTPVGLKHAIEQLNDLLQANNLTFDDFKHKSVLIPNWVNGLTDYNNLNLALRTDNAEISYTWYIDVYWSMRLQFDSKLYAITFYFLIPTPMV